MREWEWKFESVDIRDFDGCPETIVNIRVFFVLKDHDLDMVEMTDMSATFEAPNVEGFVDYDNVTPEMLRDWVIWFHSKGNETWLLRVKEHLIAQLEARVATRSRNVRVKVTENEETL